MLPPLFQAMLNKREKGKKTEKQNQPFRSVNDPKLRGKNGTHFFLSLFNLAQRQPGDKKKGGGGAMLKFVFRVKRRAHGNRLGH